MHRGLHCTKEKLVSTTLHEVVPQAQLQRLTSLAKASCDDGPTCDDMHAL
jgi:hypothetical protein